MRPIDFFWDVPVVDAICLLQSTQGTGNLKLNGSLGISSANPGRFVFPHSTRTVSLTSANNLSGVNFRIFGYLNGQLISETIAGPNANTVETTAIFDEVTQIQVNGSVTDVSVGSGTSGRFHYINFDYDSPITGIATYDAIVAGTINYSVSVTLEDIGTDPNANVIDLQANQTTSQHNTIANFACRYVIITINSSGSDGSLRFTYIFQGGHTF